MPAKSKKHAKEYKRKNYIEYNTSCGKPQGALKRKKTRFECNVSYRPVMLCEEDFREENKIYLGEDTEMFVFKELKYASEK